VSLCYCKNCKAMLYWQGMKTFFEQIPLKFWGFCVIKTNLVQTVLVDNHTKISVEICISADIPKVKYRFVSSLNYCLLMFRLTIFYAKRHKFLLLWFKVSLSPWSLFLMKFGVNVKRNHNKGVITTRDGNRIEIASHLFFPKNRIYISHRHLQKIVSVIASPIRFFNKLSSVLYWLRVATVSS